MQQISNSGVKQGHVFSPHIWLIDSVWQEVLVSRRHWQSCITWGWGPCPVLEPKLGRLKQLQLRQRGHLCSSVVSPHRLSCGFLRTVRLLEWLLKAPKVTTVRWISRCCVVFPNLTSEDTQHHFCWHLYVGTVPKAWPSLSTGSVESTSSREEYQKMLSYALKPPHHVNEIIFFKFEYQQITSLSSPLLFSMYHLVSFSIFLSFTLI